MEEALSNPLILEKILIYLPSKVARSVCRQWNDVTLSNGKLELRMRSKYSQFGQFCAEMNPKLAKCIRLSTEKTNYFADEEDFKNLSCLMNKCGEYVQEISKISFTANVLIKLCKILQNVRNFPNLRHLDMYVMYYPVKGESVVEPWPLLPQRNRLTSLNFETIGYRDFLQDYLQNLVTCAVNLEKLTLTGNWLPSLDNQRNLTYLKFTGGGNWDLAKLSQILNQVAKSLKYLHLGNLSTWNLGSDESVILTLPVMPSLQKFVNLNVSIFRMHFVDFSEQRMKQLKSLELGNLVKKSVQTMANSGEISDIINPSVTTLTLRGRVSSEMKAHFKNQFPNLQPKKYKTRKN